MPSTGRRIARMVSQLNQPRMSAASDEHADAHAVGEHRSRGATAGVDRLAARFCWSAWSCSSCSRTLAMSARLSSFMSIVLRGFAVAAAQRDDRRLDGAVEHAVEVLAGLVGELFLVGGHAADRCRCSSSS